MKGDVALTSLVTTVTETLRYRGAIGQWSWVLHRISGLGVVLFLVLHVIDTSWAVFYPAEYVRAIAEYQSPLFTIGEFALVAAVVYHAFNGLRIIIFDARPNLWKYQGQAAWAVLIGTVVLLVPVFLLMLGHVLKFYNSGRAILPLGEVLAGQVRFIVGIAVAVIAAMLLSGLIGLVQGGTTGATRQRGSKLERFWWAFMRGSGLIIIPLVFGHLAIMHIIQGVFDIQFTEAAAEAGIFAAGAVGQGANVTGTAVEFVADRWNTLVAGVAVWRVYDFALLILVVIHGFNGLRYVFTDYAGNAFVKRALVYLTIIGAVVLLVVGGAALLQSVDQTAIEEAQRAYEALLQSLR